MPVAILFSLLTGKDFFSAGILQHVSDELHVDLRGLCGQMRAVAIEVIPMHLRERIPIDQMDVVVGIAHGLESLIVLLGEIGIAAADGDEVDLLVRPDGFYGFVQLFFREMTIGAQSEDDGVSHLPVSSILLIDFDALFDAPVLLGIDMAQGKRSSK